MKFNANKHDVLKAVGAVQSVVERTPARLILINLLLKAEDGQVTVGATDNKIFIRDTFPAEVLEPGELSANASDLLNTLKLLPEGTAESWMDEHLNLHLQVGRSKYRYNTLPTDEYPEWPVPPEDAQWFTIAGKDLANYLTRTAFAISEDETRPVLCGALFQHEGGKSSIVATDGHRLALAESTLYQFESNFSMIIPRKVVQQLRRLLGEYDGEVQFCTTSTHQFFRLDTCLVAAKNIAGTFPNFRNVFPREYTHTVTFQSDQIVSLLKRVMYFQSSTIQGMNLSVEPGTMEATAQNAEKGAVEDKMQVEYDGLPFEVCYNPRYFMEIISAAGSETLTLQLHDPLGPGVITIGGENDPELQYIIMPMRNR